MLILETDREIADVASSRAKEKDLSVSERLKDIYSAFSEISVPDLENAIAASTDRNEKVLYRTLLNLKLQLEQEKIINQTLL
ncbi:MAG: hypothetical protein E7633_09830 [Ruminococcaceae bacterium]|nr:hypothetical protein [Oscillospiraceae bacterium]